MNTKFLKGVILVFIGAVCFSTKGIFAKLAFRYNINGIQLLMLRMLFSLPFYITILSYTYKKTITPRINKNDWITIFTMGIVGYYLAALFDFLGLQYVSASLERNIIFTYPTFVLLFGFLFYKRSVQHLQLIAVILCYVGIIIAFYSDQKMYMNANLTKGTIYVLLSALTYALYLVSSDKLIKNIGPIQFTCISMIISGVAVLIHYLIIYGFQLLSFPKEVYFLGFGLAIIGTVLPTFLMTKGIEIIGSSNMSIIASTGPIATIFLSYIFLQEELTLLHGFGTLLVLIGVLVLSIKGGTTELT